MSNEDELPNLHDAVLERIELVWESGLGTIDVTRVPGGPLRLAASGSRSFTMMRHEEWGSSVFVNEARVQTDEDGGVILAIEMQSGDTIEVAADRLSVE